MHRRWCTLGAALLTVFLGLGCGGYTIAKVEDVAPVEVPTKSSGSRGGGSKQTTRTAPRAASGQVQVTAFAVVEALVDGAPMPFDTAQGFVAEVPAGAHLVEIRNAWGSTVASQNVTVPSGKRVRFEYRKKSLTQTSTVSATALPAPAPAAAPVAPAVLGGSAQLDGLTPLSDRVWIDGREVGFNQSFGSYVAGNLTAGTHALRVERGGQVVYSGDLGVRSGENHRCIAILGSDWRWTLDCHFTKPAL